MIYDSPEWKALGKCLDAIHDTLDDATHKGFVRSDWKLLDRKLSAILRSAKRAKKLLATPECGCRFSDAWKCAVDKNLKRIACGCECHKYIRTDTTHANEEDS